MFRLRGYKRSMFAMLSSKSALGLAMFGLGTTELLVILALVLVLFGAGKIPQLGRGLGEGIRNFKKGLKEGETDGATPPNADRSLPTSGNEPRNT